MHFNIELAKYRGKRDDLVEQKKRETGKRKKKAQGNGKKNAEPAIQTNSASAEALPSPAAAAPIAESINPNSDRLTVAREDNIVSVAQTTAVPELRKVISMQEKLNEKNIESFKELLNAAETDRPGLVVSRREGRSR